ncbi:MAG: FAD-binding oxidoreductase, partial [Candidatus Harrisonbacteria bacterium]|nr:FAD-binding oxidoreductase [Candidatus Harrisonbacteria bacterium]
IPELSKKVYDLVLKFGGSTTGEHNDGLIRTPYVEQMYGKDVYKLFQVTKKLFDLKNIFNPGKKVDGDLDYAMEHLRTEQ